LELHAKLSPKRQQITMAHDHEYFLGHSCIEQRRLQQQAGELAEESVWLFDQVGIAQGWRVVEIGCGPQGCLELLSSRVGLTGSVIGVELSDHAVQLAREFLSERQINNVEVRQGNAAATGLPRERFDLATARLVLVNIPEPEKIVSEMAALVRSGVSLLYMRLTGVRMSAIRHFLRGTVLNRLLFPTPKRKESICT
jgi:ubiquinone/menaquinone biosynthesis C-methylase UbiE